MKVLSTSEVSPKKLKPSSVFWTIMKIYYSAFTMKGLDFYEYELSTKYKYTHTYVYIHTNRHIHTRIHTYIHTETYTHIDAYKRMYTYISARAHTHTLVYLVSKESIKNKK